jgi:hypothetical protein
VSSNSPSLGARLNWSILRSHRPPNIRQEPVALAGAYPRSYHPHLRPAMAEFRSTMAEFRFNRL